MVRVTEHVFQVMRLLDSDKPTIGWCYIWMHKLVGKIEMVRTEKDILTQRDVQSLTLKTNDRWENLYANVHGAAFLLNPYVQASGYVSKLTSVEKAEVKRSLKAVFTKFYPKGTAKRAQCLKSFAAFENQDGDFGDDVAIAQAEDKEALDMATWWQAYGDDHPLLQNVAMRLLSQTATASACERKI